MPITVIVCFVVLLTQGGEPDVLAISVPLRLLTNYLPDESRGRLVRLAYVNR